MGCGIAVRGPQSPIYANEFSPPIHELIPLPIAFPENFPPSGNIFNENGAFFDDREFIKQCQIVHINEITVYMEKYVCGIEVQYFLDGGIRIAKHLGKAQGKKYILPLQNSDSIIECTGTFEGTKAKSLRLLSLDGRVMDLVSLEGPGPETFSLNLRTQKRAIVAFKGKVDDYIEGLRMLGERWKKNHRYDQR